jgi:3-hydroxyacyl-CoA dehydrogenase/enoyl-CoA hydratase/3-hydroxybutyryl-CoA epimerase
MTVNLKHFSYVVEDGVALITFDLAGEVVNTLSPEVSAEFEGLMTHAASDPSARAVVILSGKKDTFIAGAKLDFLASLGSATDAARASRQAQAGFDRLDAFEQPVIAAIHGACLGGGLEWALACDYRIASDSPKTTLGLPETQLGLIPGAGGTQRLPRLIGAQAAIDLILAAKMIKPRKALKLGLVDEVVPQSILRAVAVKRARELADGTLRPNRARTLAETVKHSRTLGDVFSRLANRDAWTGLALEENPVGRRGGLEAATPNFVQRASRK